MPVTPQARMLNLRVMPLAVQCVMTRTHDTVAHLKLVIKCKTVLRHTRAKIARDYPRLGMPARMIAVLVSATFSVNGSAVRRAWQEVASLADKGSA